MFREHFLLMTWHQKVCDLVGNLVSACIWPLAPNV